MLTVWRIVAARFVEGAFSGEGARRFGGRWNRKGVPLVCTSGSQSLAMLEMLVQDEPLRASNYVIPAEITAE
jgi:RES domain-containing protein